VSGFGRWGAATLRAANRDPAQFVHPDIFDIHRQPNTHLAFGSGIHFCLGPVLARMEARIAFAVLLEMLPDIGFGSEPATWDTRITAVRGLRALPLVV
jgi:cytochrome P450